MKMFIKMIYLIDLFLVTGVLCGDEIRFPGESGTEQSIDNSTEQTTHFTTTTNQTKEKSRGDSCEQYNGSNGICRDTKFCLKQQPTQKMWKVCEWPNHMKVPSMICCSSDAHMLEEVFNDIINDTIDDEEKDEELENSFLKCGLSKVLPKDVVMPEVRGRRDSEISLFDLLLPVAYRVVMGNSVRVGQIPWMCAIYFRGQFVCGGTIIDERHIVSAAHCFDASVNPIEYHVRVGSVMLYNGTFYRLSKIKQHEKYFPPRIYHDIALMTVKNRINFNDEVSPACLPTRKMFGEHLLNKTSNVAGFGDLSFGGAQALTLQEVDLLIMNNSNCEENYRNLIESKTKFPLGIKHSLICAGHEQGGKDACQGDSGGPLSTTFNGRTHLIGIVSFGYKCAMARFPGVYTCVAFYLNWIRRNLI